MEIKLSDQECDKLASECLRAVNKVARLTNNKYGGIRDINDNLKGRANTKEKVKYLKSLLEEFPNIQEIRDPYQTLLGERNAAIMIRDATYRKLNNCPATLEESNELKNESKKELEKRLREIRPIAKKREELVSYLEGQGQEKSGVGPAMVFLTQLEELYNTEVKAMSNGKDAHTTSTKKSILTPEKTELLIINSCATTLGINEPSKRDTFIKYIEALLLKKRLAILDNSICFYNADINSELKQRKLLIAFSYILYYDNIVDRPSSHGVIPATKYAAAFTYSLDGKIVEKFTPKHIQDLVSTAPSDLINSLKSDLKVNCSASTPS